MRMACRISFSYSCNSKWLEALKVQRRGRAEDSKAQAVRQVQVENRWALRHGTARNLEGRGQCLPTTTPRSLNV